MSAVSFRQSELPGTSPLFRDLLCNFAAVGGFFSHPPSVEAACNAASEVRMPLRHRRQLVDELSRQNANGDDATRASLDRLSDAATVVVATGQQVGLLGGPAFTLYKALTAVRCAERLTRRGVSAVPVFWLATEDHDLAEVNHAWTFDQSSHPHCIQAVTEGADGAAVGNIRVTDARLDDFDSLCSGLPYSQEAVGLASEAYGGSVEFGQSFQSLYESILGGSGIIFLSPMGEGIRALAAPLVRTAIQRASGLTDLLLRRGVGLEAAGYHQQVRFQPSTSLLMLFENAKRESLKRRNGSYWLRSRSFTPEDLLARVDTAPYDLSPNALLRPVMQDYLLPTAALVVGPSEAAYLAQSAALYEELLGRMPVVMPRASFTVLDATTRKLLRKHGLSPADCWVPRQALDSAIASSLVPPPLRGTLRTQSARIGELLRTIEGAIAGFDPTLAESFKRSKGKIEYQLGKTRTKVKLEALRRSGTARRHAAKLAGFLYPDGHVQERRYSVLSFMAKFGPSFIDCVRAATEPGCPDHKILEI